MSPPEDWQEVFRHWRPVAAEPDGWVVAYEILAICTEQHLALPRWAALKILEHGRRFLNVADRRGHSPTPASRDEQRDVDRVRHDLVEKFRSEQKLTYLQAVEATVTHLEAVMQSIKGDRRRPQLDGGTKAVMRSYARHRRRLKRRSKS